MAKLGALGVVLPPGPVRVDGYGDSEALSEALITLIRRGQKRAGTGLLWASELESEPLPRPGDIEVVVDHRHEPVLVTRLTSVEIVPYAEVTAEYAAIEGEGDGSLDYWRKAHWAYFSRECKRIGREPAQTMPVVCCVFELLSFVPPVTLLVPMRAEAYAAYKAAEVAAYAEEKVKAGMWAKEGALECSLAEIEGLLPLGLATPDHHLFEMVAAEGGPTVGTLWFAVEERNGHRGAYVYNVEVTQAFRRQGHARRAFRALEAMVASMGLARIALHVSGFNTGAQDLYRQLGFEATGISMLKTLGGQAG